MNLTQRPEEVVLTMVDLSRRNLFRLAGGGVVASGVIASLGLNAYGPYHSPEEEPSQEATEVVIQAGNFFFEGPAGHSESSDNPQVVAQLANEQPYRLVFENVSRMRHQVISPLLNDQSRDDHTLGQDTVYELAVGEQLAFEITPQFLTVEKGKTLQFDLSCHVAGHFSSGMRGTIEVVPAG